MEPAQLDFGQGFARFRLALRMDRQIIRFCHTGSIHEGICEVQTAGIKETD